MSIRPFRDIKRRVTKVINVGKVKIGGDNPISVQSMTNTITRNVKETLNQINKISEAGGDIVRVSCPDEESTNAETQGGYAKEMSNQYKKKQEDLIKDTISKQDIVICTALIPGKKDPILITQQMVESMDPGSVIVDLAVEVGGNCTLSKINEIVVHNSVKILGYANVPGRVAKDASALYAKNIFNFLSLLINKDENTINLDWEDEIISSVILTHDGSLKLKQFM